MKPPFVRAAIVLIAAAMLSSSARADWAPRLSLDFETGLNGVDENGRPIQPRIEGNPRLVEGRFGKALLTGPGAGYLDFPIAGILSCEAVTIEMWVSPRDWDGSDEHFHVFFDAHGGGALYLYKYQHGGLLLTSAVDESGPFTNAPASISSWRRGQWHHIAGTWDGKEQKLYIDGALVSTVVAARPHHLHGELRIGDHPWQVPRTSQSVIDRVRVYNRVLCAAEIAAHAKGNDSPALPFAASTEELSFMADSTGRMLDVQLHFLGRDDRIRAARVSFTLTRNGRVVSKTESMLREGIAAGTLDIRRVAPGPYSLAADTLVGASTVAHLVKAVEVPTLEWMNNRYGLGEAIPPPWTALTVTRRGPITRVAVLGRGYDFVDSALPAQIYSAGRPLLAKPVRVIVRRQNAEIRWHDASARVAAASPRSATISSVATSDGADPRFDLSMSSRLEYDGLSVTTIDLASADDTSAPDIDIDIPIRRDVAVLRHRWASAGKGLSGGLDFSRGAADHGSFVPFIWLGDDERGLFWFCESAQHWPNASSDRAFEIVQTAEAVTLRLHLVNGQRIGRTWKYQFGLQATPVKPPSQTAKRIRLAPANDANSLILWPSPTKQSERYFGYAEAMDPAGYRAEIDRLHQNKLAVIVYSLLTMSFTATPEWRWFGQSWAAPGTDANSSDVERYGGTIQQVVPTSTTYSDFIVWKNVMFMRRYHVDGFYNDYSLPLACMTGQPGCGWAGPDGRLHPTYPILAYRDLYRRLYAAVKAENPNAILIGHSSGNVTIPMLAYEDIYLEGEQFRGAVHDSYLDVLPTDAFRAEFDGRPWGVVPLFLPEATGAPAKVTSATESLTTLLLLHDVEPWSQWCDLNVVEKAQASLQAFDARASTFIPYYSDRPAAKSDNPSLRVSGYRKNDATLLVVGNLSHQPQTGIVTVSDSEHARKITAFPQGTPLPHAAAQRFRVDIPAQSYRLVRVERAQVTPGVQ